MQKAVTQILGSNPKVSDIQRVLECLNNRIDEIESRNSNQNPSLKPAFKPKNAASTSTSGIFEFNIEKCNRISGVVECIVFITAQGKDGKLGIGDLSSLFDDQGAQIRIANLRFSGINKKLNSYHALIQGVPVRAKLTFRGVSRSARYASAVRINTGGTDIRGWKMITLRNIPIK